ncbi:MAG: killer suppression protein HigA [Ectothiorhodospiraceae bacterium]|nr:killer suppression protein HigA [Ectothiorhodospiraceae bacterium]MCH8503811.1 killer suppression protein HigA [Ectothiorhodospiraceae bacterium]
MNVTYKDAAIEELCLQQRIAQKELGKPGAKKLKSRLADLYAAANPTDLPVGHPHPLRGDRLGQYAVNLHGGVRLCIEPKHNPPPLKQDGGIDWASVTDIVIVYIGDYHD